MTIPSAAEEFERRYPDVAEAFRKAEETAKAVLFNSATSQKDEREQIYYAVRGLREAKKKLMEAIDDKSIKKLTEDHAATLANNG